MATTFSKTKPEYNNEPQSNADVALTSFYGGTRNGRSLQLTLSDGLSSKYSLLTKADVQKVVNDLNRWLNGDDLSEIEY